MAVQLLLFRVWLSRVGLTLCAVFFVATTNAELEIEGGYVRGLPPGQPVTAAFMRLINTGNSAVEINAATTDSAERAEIHVHRHSHGMMRMERVGSIIVPANGDFILAPGEYHLMLINLHKPLREGDSVNIELHSKSGDVLTAQLSVRSVLNEHHEHQKH
ncbi:MAG: copper chaperone PCu(A)C [Pseudomonadales bacterium]